MSLGRKTVQRHGHFVDITLRCLSSHRACRGVLLLSAKSQRGGELSRTDLDVPAGKRWVLEIRINRKGLAYLKTHRRVSSYLTLVYNQGQIDLFPLTIVSRTKAGLAG